MAPSLRFDRLTKHYGPIVAVDGLTATIQPARVTALLGPNGAGKTTVLRMLLGLVRPTHGTATFDSVPYDGLNRPARQVGALIDGSGFHPGRRAIDHLRVLSAAAGLDPSAPERALAAVSLAGVAGRKVGEFSLGMRQRLGLAAALLGDPRVLILDEPANGLDPHGIRWLRDFLRGAAEEGRTVLLSSHVLAEVEQVADEVLVMVKGHVVWQGALAELRRRFPGRTNVVSPEVSRLRTLLLDAGYSAGPVEDASLATSAPAEVVGELASVHGVVLHQLVTAPTTLEDAFVALTAASP